MSWVPGLHVLRRRTVAFGRGAGMVWVGKMVGSWSDAIRAGLDRRRSGLRNREAAKRSYMTETFIETKYYDN